MKIGGLVADRARATCLGICVNSCLGGLALLSAEVKGGWLLSEDVRSCQLSTLSSGPVFGVHGGMAVSRDLCSRIVVTIDVNEASWRCKFV